jgi:hypothetical protein
MPYKDVKLIAEYIKSISVEENSKRLNLLHETIVNCGFEKLDDEDVKERVKKDRHKED